MNLNECREHLTLTLECGRSQKVKLMGTTADPYFCAKDVCELLGYTSIKDALYKHVDEDEKKELKILVEEVVAPGATTSMVLGKQYDSLSYNDGKAVYVNEPGLYSLILSSKAPFAKAFKKLVCTYILPSIRQYGSYEVTQQLMAQLTIREESEAKLKEELDEAREYMLRLKDMLISNHKRPKDQIIYISTSEAYARQNRFKVGGVKSNGHLNSRLSQYNGRSAEGDVWYYSDLYYVANFREVEHRMEDVMGRFRDSVDKEMYIIHYNNLKYFLDFICNHYEDEVDEFNQSIDELIANLNRYHLRAVVPKPYQGVGATVVEIVDGQPTNVTINLTTEELFKRRVQEYLNTLSPSTTELHRYDVFGKVPFSFNKNDGWRWLKELKPDHIKLKYK